MDLDCNPFYLEAARLAGLGYRVFPCVPDTKRPFTPRGLKDATTDLETIRGWWTDTPHANLAMVTDGLLVVDCEVDKVTGAPNLWLEQLRREHSDFFHFNRISNTPSGGKHHFFRQMDGVELRNTTGKISIGVNTIANGGYVLVAPSQVNGKPYTWRPTATLDRGPERLMIPPAWLTLHIINGTFSHPSWWDLGRRSPEDLNQPTPIDANDILQMAARHDEDQPPTDDWEQHDEDYEYEEHDHWDDHDETDEQVEPYQYAETDEQDEDHDYVESALPEAFSPAPAPAPATPHQAPTPTPTSSIPEGERNAALIRYAGQMRRFGATQAEILAALRQRNQDRCQPPLTDAEVQQIAWSISRYPDDPHSTAKVEGTDSEKVPRISLKRTSMATVTAEAIEWLWPGRIPLGKLTLFAGDPAMGKSLLSMDIAARTSRGAGWPDLPDHRHEPGHTLFMNCEDDLGDTVRPRLDKAGADSDLVTALEYVHYTVDTDTAVTIRTFDLNRDLTLLQAEIIATPNLKLLVIDPISAYCGDTDSHRNTDVRGMLAPLDELARRHNIAIILVTHLSKSGNNTRAVYRSMGSLAFVAAARTAWAIDKDPQDDTRKLFVPIKFNCGPSPTPLAYRITTTGHIEWDHEPVTYTADELLTGVPGNSTKARTRVVDEWLRAYLQNGPRESSEVIEAARKYDITFKQLEKAKGRLGVRSTKATGQGKYAGWIWSLPVEDPGTPGESTAPPEVPF